MKLFKNLKIYSQNQLIKLKTQLQERIDKLCSVYTNQKDYLEYTNEYKEIIRLQGDLKKIKGAIAFNNTIFSINPLIYKREIIKKRLDHLISIQSKFRTNSKRSIKVIDYFMLDSTNNKQSIEFFIDILKREFDIIGEKLTSKNKHIRCLLKLSENYK